MRLETHVILLSGAGQLGSRYLQGLAKCRQPLRIYVQDRYDGALDLARQRWSEVVSPDAVHEVSFHSSLEEMPPRIDIAIVATTADSRPGIVTEISGLADVKYWVLEKVLAQSESGLDEIMSRIGKGAGTWVNTPRRMMPWHQQIRTSLGLARPMTLQVTGGAWGLACNAVHFLDLFSWWTGETLRAIHTESLSPHWFESKRPGCWEVAGTLEAEFSGGSCAKLSADQGTAALSLELRDGQLSWLIDESRGTARRSDGKEIAGRMVYQSDMSAGLVDGILATGGCGLPTLAESTALHRVFIRGMQEHWKQAGNPAATCVPIT